VRVRRGDAVRRLIQRDKTPLAVLLMAAVVGTLAGWWASRLKKRQLGAEPAHRRAGAGGGPLVSGLAAGLYPLRFAGDGGLFSRASFCAGGGRIRDPGN
jgi:hypothetical protein